MVLNNQGWAKKIYGFHQLIATFAPIPDLVVTLDPATMQPSIAPKMRDNAPVMLAHITMDEATALADASYAVAEKYDLAKYFNGPGPVLLTALTTVGMVYYPKFKTIKLLLQIQKMQKGQQPQTAADYVNPQQETKAPAGGDPGGVYKYQ